MAKKLSDKLTYEEYLKLIEKIADFVIKTESSTRKTAEYFTENGIKISNATISTLLQKRNAKNVNQDSDVILRMQKAAELLLQGNTIPEIANILETTENIIYNDLTTRIKRLNNEELTYLVANELEKHRMQNLKNVSKK